MIVAQGLAPTRSSAQRLIERGAVQWQTSGGWTVVKKAGEDLPEYAELRVTDDAELRYVSRGGLKLEGALKTSGIAAQGLVVLDVGQSTGGFTDCLLKAGATRVVGVDVGHGQLHVSLKSDTRVVTLEGLHVRELTGSALARHAPAPGFELIVGDLSFISMLGALPQLDPWLRSDGQVLLLIKPQFELGPQAIGRGGLLKNAALLPQLETRTREAAHTLGWQVLGYFESAVTGGDGNHEFFLWARKGGPDPEVSP